MADISAFCGKRRTRGDIPLSCACGVYGIFAAGRTRMRGAAPPACRKKAEAPFRPAAGFVPAVRGVTCSRAVGAAGCREWRWPCSARGESRPASCTSTPVHPVDGRTSSREHHTRLSACSGRHREFQPPSPRSLCRCRRKWAGVRDHRFRSRLSLPGLDCRNDKRCWRLASRG